MRGQIPYLVLMASFLLVLSAPADVLKPVTVAILRDGDSPYFDETAEMLKSELTILAAGEWSLTFIEGAEWTADWDPGRARDILRAAIENQDVDVIYAGGMLINKAVLAYKDRLPKPVVSGFIEDPSTIGLPISDEGRSTIPNYTFVVVPCEAEDDVTLFRQIVPFNRLAVLVDEHYLLHSPEVRQIAEDYMQATGVRVDLVPMTRSAEASLAAIPGDAQAVYLTPSVVMDSTETQKLIDGIKALKRPSFSMMGLEDVRRGIMAGQRNEDNLRVIRRLALNTQQILLGSKPETLPVLVDSPTRLVMNARTARDIGVALPYRMMLNADVLHPEETETGKPIDLTTAYQLALENSPAVAAGQEEVNMAKEDRLLARSYLFPRLQANLQYVQVDRDRALSSLGLQPHKTTAGGISIMQVIFNDPAITAFRAQSLAYQARRFEQTAREMDTLEQVASAYINLLSRKALLGIEARNQEQIQNYLDIARNRERSGMAGPEEIHRWEAQLAAARSSVLDAYTEVSLAQTLLNQAMGGSMDDLWNPADSDALVANNPFFDEEFVSAIQSDREYNAMSEFLLNYALDYAPELQALDFAIQAQTLVVNQYRRRFVVPEVGVSFQADHTFSKTLADSGEADPFPLMLPEGKDDTWMVAAVASWPLFEGGGKAADLRKAKAELNRLKELRRQAEQYVTQRLYDALLSTSSSDPAIALTRRAAELAAKSLDIVRRKYALGQVAIVDLLDAQSDLFVQEQRAILARYQFMLDVIRGQRALGWFPEVQDAQDRDAWFLDLDKAIQQAAEEWR